MDNAALSSASSGATPPPADSTQVRTQLVNALRIDLVGPPPGHPFAEEVLDERPSRWYLTGYLLPTGTKAEQRMDETALDELEQNGVEEDDDGGTPPERSSSVRSLLPVSLGLSVLVPAAVNELTATVTWGDYRGYLKDGRPADEVYGLRLPAAAVATDPEAVPPPLPVVEDPEDAGEPFVAHWRRIPRSIVRSIKLPAPGEPRDFELPQSGGLKLHVAVREAKGRHLPPGTRAVAVFLINERPPAGAEQQEVRDQQYIFQAGLELSCAAGFTPRPDGRLITEETDWDVRVADLQYRHTCDYAVGHGVATETVLEDQQCRVVRSAWVPQAEVERVEPAELAGVELGMEALAGFGDSAAMREALRPLVGQYRQWLTGQEAQVGAEGLDQTRADTGRDLIAEARQAAVRIEHGIGLLAQPDVMEAFQLANRTVAQAYRQRDAASKGITPEQIAPPKWRPFQLAFILISLRGIVEPEHGDREIVDLLFFPTGGGKTEAYLGLAAFTLALRRIRSRDAAGRPQLALYAGVTILMRYTLRLLTLDQLSRAAGLICALERERQLRPQALGDWPFEIGLWVGQSATPNRLGGRKYDGVGKDETAYARLKQFQRDPRRGAPVPIEECPWCGKPLTINSFTLQPAEYQPTKLEIRCVNFKCPFSQDKRPLPIVAVDESIYRRLPCFMIATVDKLASLPFVGRSGALFGKARRSDSHGFYGPCDPHQGTPLPVAQLLPPDLIIQDELHLISGPLGTIAGLYETAVDELCSRRTGDKKIRAKIVSSTATVRRADNQIQALFGRKRVCVFPPPGPDLRDSFFARTQAPEKTPARLYVGVAAQGRSLKVVLLRVALALLSATQRSWELAGGDTNRKNPADPYMTLLGYFNSLRELGGSRRIFEDEVKSRLEDYGKRRRREPEDRTFASRQISSEVQELTSRVQTTEIAATKSRLARSHADAKHIDVALATNMISVGLDIVRLGLMTVLGQPKSSAEYIQTTSRVGRDRERPGLVVTLLNVHKPRDRSHYESFTAFHRSFYRSVEATSVTPFSPRALDRGLAGALVALCRHMDADLTPPEGAKEIAARRTALDELVQLVAERAAEHSHPPAAGSAAALRTVVSQRCKQLLDNWVRIAQVAEEEYRTPIQYDKYEAQTSPLHLLYAFLDQELEGKEDSIEMSFRANRSMRDVEAEVELRTADLNNRRLYHA